MRLASPDPISRTGSREGRADLEIVREVREDMLGGKEEGFGEGRGERRRRESEL